MRINGFWQRDSEYPEMVRPVIATKVLTQGQELPLTFLVDTGADRTVLGSAFAEILKDFAQDSQESLFSAGGTIDYFYAALQLEFQDDNNRPIRFSTSCAVLTDLTQRNEHLLGRDILDYFALICDREADQVTLLRPPHKYIIR